MKNKYIVEIRENGEWTDCGEGYLTQKQAERIAREIRQDTGTPTRIRPAQN